MLISVGKHANDCFNSIVLAKTWKSLRRVRYRFEIVVLEAQLSVLSADERPGSGPGSIPGSRRATDVPPRRGRARADGDATRLLTGSFDLVS